jgi:hypothetical protein
VVTGVFETGAVTNLGHAVGNRVAVLHAGDTESGLCRGGLLFLLECSDLCSESASTTSATDRCEPTSP